MDLDYCRDHGLPVSRREVGGGAVYLDAGQLFVQWVFHRDALPASLEAKFELYIRPLVETYQALGSRRITGRSTTSTSRARRSAARARRRWAKPRCWSAA